MNALLQNPPAPVRDVNPPDSNSAPLAHFTAPPPPPAPASGLPDAAAAPHATFLPSAPPMAAVAAIPPSPPHQAHHLLMLPFSTSSTCSSTMPSSSSYSHYC